MVSPVMSPDAECINPELIYHRTWTEAEDCIIEQTYREKTKKDDWIQIALIRLKEMGFIRDRFGCVSRAEYLMNDSKNKTTPKRKLWFPEEIIKLNKLAKKYSDQENCWSYISTKIMMHEPEECQKKSQECKDNPTLLAAAENDLKFYDRELIHQIKELSDQYMENKRRWVKVSQIIGQGITPAKCEEIYIRIFESS